MTHSSQSPSPKKGHTWTLTDWWEYWLLCLIKSGEKLAFLPFEVYSNRKNRNLDIKPEPEQDDTSPEVIMDTSALIKLTSTRRLCIWGVFVICFTLDLGYLTFASKKVKLKTCSERDFLNFYTHFNSRLVSGVLMWLTTIHLKETVYFLNVLLETRRRFQEKYSGYPNVNGCTRYSQMGTALMTFVSLIFSHVQPFLPLMLHLRHRHSAMYWPAQYLPRHIYNSPLFAILFALLDLLYSYLGIFVSNFVILMVTSYIILAYVWITMLKEKIKKGLITNSAILLYKEQLILNRMANAYYAYSIMPTFMAGGMIILALLLVSIIHNANLLPPVIIFNYSMVICVLLIAFRFALNIGGKLLKTSMRVKRQLIIATKQRQVESRVTRGLGELRVYMRGIMYFRKVQFLLYLRVVLMRTINLLLITRGRLEIN